MRVYIVDPRSIQLVTDPPKRWIAQQMNRLESEGQIEPIQLDASGNQVSDRAWIYSEAQIVAAIELGWPTILVTC